ncbi:MAG: chemotaxis histidine kinase [Candidatus Scalindua rubra]|uniref:histidine kinase n=1 Tax=Candidatus Scalindua rubra TaxID=1872076 RepID=A0A1E3XG73_9BACT|nr:MAG: chemotaxis histidine kinase [Candidatus Scalindua rubra]
MATVTTKQSEKTGNVHTNDITVEIPANMETSLLSIREVCKTMFGILLEATGKPKLFSADGMEYGVGLSLLRAGGSWELGLFGSRDSCHNLARAFLDLNVDEEPQSSEVVDLLGEIVNMVSGVVKRSIPGGDEINFGVPLHLIAEDCKTYVPHTIPVVAQPLSGSDFEGEILLVWSERDSASLASEIAGVLSDSTPSETQLLGRVIALFEEFEECLDEAGNDDISKTIDNCSSIVMGLINENIPDGDTALQWVRTSVNELATALRERHTHLYKAPSLPDFKTAEKEEKLAEQVPVERDDETLEIITDFLQESDEGLSNADQILMRLEGGADDPDGINALFRVFHSIKGLSSFLGIKDVTNLAHTTETLLDLSRDGKIKLSGAPLDIVFEATEMMRLRLDDARNAVENKLSFPQTRGLAKLISRLEAVIRGESIPAREVPASQPVTPTTVQAAPAKLKETVKISVDLIERLALIAASFNKIEPQIANLKSTALSEEVHKDLITACAEVYEVATLMRMVPILMLFQKMTRMVRDLSKKTGKLARLVLSGEDTMIARNMIEKLKDPLIHMIRNAVDHGIEDAEVRKAAGKPPLGTVQLSARCEDDNGKKHAIIELKDDGKGLDPKVLIEKAVSKDVIESGTELTDEEAFKLIFAAGFSTAANVTAISGRGVGMDVVRNNIEALGGKILITSEVGTGSTFTITLPWGT